MLTSFLGSGVRPAGKGAEPWTFAELAGHLNGAGENESMSPRSVANWCRGRSLPQRLEKIERALFGRDGSANPRQTALREAYLAARAEADAAVIARAKPDEAGSEWIVVADEIVAASTATPSDLSILQEPSQRQLQQAILRYTAQLSVLSRRLSNHPIFANMSTAAGDLESLLVSEDKSICEQMGWLYAIALELAQYHDDNQNISNNIQSSYSALDENIAGRLQTLVGLMAPWLRSIPSIASLDDKAGQLLRRPDIVADQGVAASAAQAKVIPLRDAKSLDRLHEIAAREGFQADKARGRFTASVRNLLLTMSKTYLTLMIGAVGSDLAPNSILATRLAAALARAEVHIETLSSAMPRLLGQAVKGAVERASHPWDIPPLIGAPTGSLPSPDDIDRDDIEERARDLILRGIEPPADWRPAIHVLDFTGSDLIDLTPLAGLTALETLWLSSTAVIDLTPLAGLTALETLGLDSTAVSDLTPLAGLTALETLWLDSTAVSDLTPLAGLTALERLWLNSTAVIDLTPLAGLTALETLRLGSTAVIDLTPLAGLTALETLWLNSTAVIDLTPLAGLTALETLGLDSTAVIDLTPLAGLTALETLWLSSTAVIDLTPLAGLTALETLGLDSTAVIDLTPLAGLTALETLRLDSTAVIDLTPLAGLTALERLWLNSTAVIDLTPLAGLTALETLRLGSTAVIDLTPLAGLTALETLWLNSTAVIDLTPLAGLTALETLGLDSTAVSDLTPLAGLTALETLGLDSTAVSDLTPLAGLTALERLWLRSTAVSDLTPLAGLTKLTIVRAERGQAVSPADGTDDDRKGVSA